MSVVFSMGKSSKKPKTAMLIYQLLLDEETDTWAFKDSLFGVSLWREKLNKLAEYEVSVVNAEFEESAAERNNFLFYLSNIPNQISNRLSERYSADLKSSDISDEGWNMPSKL